MTDVHAAPAVDQAEAIIPRPRAAEQVPGTGELQVREWRRLGRHCLFVEAADGRTVGMLNVNTGLATPTNEAERPQFEAAIIAWFADALDGPQPAVVPEAIVELPTIEAPEAASAAAAEPAATGFRMAARTRARREGPGAGVRARFTRILEEYAEEAKRNRGASAEPQVAPQQEQAHPEGPEAPPAPAVHLHGSEVSQEARRGRHRSGQASVDPDVGSVGTTTGGKHRRG